MLRAARTLLALSVSSSLILHPSSFAHAAHPFVTDDAGTQGAGNWQLELMAQQDRHGATAPGPLTLRERATLFNPVLTYGLSERVDVAIGASYLRNRAHENAVPVERESGAGDSAIELKWRFFERGGAGFALKPGVSLPTGEEQRGLGSGRPYWGINLIGDYQADPWAVFGNVAFTRARYRLAQDAADNRDRLWRVSAGATRDVGGNVKLAGEFGVRTNESRNDPFRPGRHARFAMIGAIYSPAERIDLDIGLRKGLNDAETDTTLLIGGTFRW